MYYNYKTSYFFLSIYFEWPNNSRKAKVGWSNVLSRRDTRKRNIRWNLIHFPLHFLAPASVLIEDSPILSWNWFPSHLNIIFPGRSRPPRIMTELRRNTSEASLSIRLSFSISSSLSLFLFLSMPVYTVRALYCIGKYSSVNQRCTPYKLASDTRQRLCTRVL